MTLIEFKEVARRCALVQWTASGIIEKLRLTKDGTVVARRVFERKEHYIRPQVEYRCRAVDISESFTIGDLLR